MITNSGGINVSRLILEDAAMKSRISFITDISGSLFDACMKPMTAYATSAIASETPVV